MKEEWMKNDKVWMKDELRMMKDEGWMMKDEGWMMKDDDLNLLRGFEDQQTDRWMNRQTLVNVELLLQLKRQKLFYSNISYLLGPRMEYSHISWIQQIVLLSFPAMSFKRNPHMERLQQQKIPSFGGHRDR